MPQRGGFVGQNRESIRPTVLGQVDTVMSFFSAMLTMYRVLCERRAKNDYTCAFVKKLVVVVCAIFNV